jgi:hypothetical protein
VKFELRGVIATSPRIRTLVIGVVGWSADAGAVRGSGLPLTLAAVAVAVAVELKPRTHGLNRRVPELG